MSAAFFQRPTRDVASQCQCRHVLVVISDFALRTFVVDGCRSAAVPVRGVRSIAEIEDWPIGQIVVTDAEHVTPFWRTVGAAELIVLARNAGEWTDALERGATGWLQVPLSAAAVAALAAVAKGSFAGVV